MTPDAAKWSLFDLLKTLDSIHAGEFHAEFARAAQGLGLELPAVAPLPDPPSDGADETDGEVLASERICQFLESQTAPVSLAKIIAELDLRRWTATGTLNRLQRQGRIEHPGHDAWQIRKPG